MRRSSVLFLIMLCTWSMLGFGCKPHNQRLSIAPGGTILVTPRAPETPYISKGGGDHAPQPQILELRQVLANLERAQSYRSRIRTPLSSGNLMAVLLFSRKNGLYGTIQSGGVNSELLIQGSTVSVRYGTSTWENVSGNEETQAVRKQLYDSLLVNENGTSRILLRDSAKVVSTKDDPEGCKLYTVEQTFFQPDIFTQTIDICVKNTYPTRIKSVTPGGTIEISYDRFDDTTILAESPKK